MLETKMKIISCCRFPIMIVTNQIRISEANQQRSPSFIIMDLKLNYTFNILLYISNHEGH